MFKDLIDDALLAFIDALLEASSVGLLFEVVNTSLKTDRSV